MYNEKWIKWKSKTIKNAKVAGDLNDSLRLLATKISKYYPGIKIWFTQKLGKRESYIAGAGQEQYIAPQKYKLNSKYNVFLQDNNLKKEDKEKIIEICRIIISEY